MVSDQYLSAMIADRNPNLEYFFISLPSNIPLENNQQLFTVPLFLTSCYFLCFKMLVC